MSYQGRLSARVQPILEQLYGELGLNWAQIEGLRSITRDMSAGHKKVYANMAMGSGKTGLELAYMEACFRAGENIEGMIFTNGQDDVANILDKEAPRWAPELHKSGALSVFLPSSGQTTPFGVATYTAGAAGLKKGYIKLPDFIFLDEAQGALSELRQGLLAGVEDTTQLIGLTATPAYSYRKSLNMAGYKESYRLPFEVAVARSLLSSYRNILLEVSDPKREIDEIEIVNGDFDQKKLEQLMRRRNVMETVKHFMATWRHPETGQSFFERKGLISCCSVMHAAFVAQDFNNTFLPEMREGVSFALPIWSSSKYLGTLSDQDRKKIMDMHRSGDVRFLTTKDLLLTGHDDCTIDTVLNLRPTPSMVLVPQRGGRSVRFDPENPDKEAHIIDLLLESDSTKQRFFAEYAGSAMIETEDKRHRREEDPESIKRRGSSRSIVNYNALPAPPYKLYYDHREIRSYILSKKMRETMARRPWIASTLSSLHGAIIHSDIASRDDLIRKVADFAVSQQWNEDSTKYGRGEGRISKGSIIKALTGGYVKERESANKAHYDEISKRWKANERKIEAAKKAERPDRIALLMRNAAELEEELRLPLKHTYTMAEVAISAVLGGHASKLFGDIKTPPSSRMGRRVRSLPTDKAYVPDHILSHDLPVVKIVEQDYAQTNFANLFHQVVWDEFQVLRPNGFDEPFRPEFAEEFLCAVIDDILVEKNEGVGVSPLNYNHEMTLRRYYQMQARSNEERESLPWDDRSVKWDYYDIDKLREYGLTRESPKEAWEVLHKKQLEGAVSDVLLDLPPRYERILRARFGLGMKDGEEATLEDIGASMGVTRERIRQMETKALQILKHPARSKRLMQFMPE